MSDSQPVIETTALFKSYGPEVTAVRDLSIAIRPGEVYGFLGRNGAGKTTTMRMLVGLVRPTGGSAQVLGWPLGDPAALRRVGALIEAPAFQPHLSGRDNLRMLAHYNGESDAQVAVVLSQVGLTDPADRKFRMYSLGMKQRLGIAAALLGEPELLIVDEPTNGVDPAGIAELRELFRDLAATGCTVFLSSHQLTEVEHICDRIGILHEGRLVAEGTVAQLRSRRAGAGAVRVRVTPVPVALAALSGLVDDAAVAVHEQVLEIAVDVNRAAEINRILVTAGVDVSELVVSGDSLEDLFLNLTDAVAHGLPSASMRAEPTEVMS